MGTVRVFIISALIFFVLIYFCLNLFSYFDPLKFCYISIKGDFRGNKKTIKEALSYLKKNNRQAYQTTCRYVNYIGENFCHAADSRVTPEADRYLSGCYVRGSKSIYLRPEKDETEEIIKKRVENIAKFAAYSQEFWNG